jgi:NADPH-dependent curcumin reductase CurA
MPELNRQWILTGRPEGMLDASIFELRESPIPKLENREVLAKTLYFSFDPTQRMWMAKDTYMPIVPLGQPMRAVCAAQVIESKHPKYKVGDMVNGIGSWQEYISFSPDDEESPPTKVPGHLDPALTLALAGTGLTAYFGMLEIGKPKPGETVLVSGAAGATGSVAGQIAKMRGCRVIGIAGGPEKCAWLTEKARFDASIDYKNDDVEQRIGALCPDGIDVYFDNVGGEILDAALLHLAMHARVVLCGSISQYNAGEGEQYGIKNHMELVVQRGRAEGFIILDYLDRAIEALLCLNKWVDEGKIVQEIDMQEGFENVPATLTRIFTGANLGKQLLKVADPPLPLRTSGVEQAVMGVLARYFEWRSSR